MIVLANESKTSGIGLFLVRVLTGSMMITHGFPKLLNFSEMVEKFPDPIGFGAKFTVGFTILAELVASITLILGILPRTSALLGLITMAGAFFIVHRADPFATKELAALYGTLYLTIVMCGGGRFQIKND
jgi:putative oxidoreductase